MFLQFLQIWQGKYLPARHIFIKRQDWPEGWQKIVRLYYRKWVTHPLRRRRTRSKVKFFLDQGATVIGIAGAAGKTSTKEMIAAVLSTKFKTVKSPKNIDPVYNIPTTVLNAPLDTKKLVLEYGIEFPGEMDFYMWLARPSIAVVTTLDLEHTEYLGSLDDVVYEEGKIVAALPEDGYALLNIDDPKTKVVAKRTKCKVLWYGNRKDADFRVSRIRITNDFTTVFNFTYKGKITKIEIPLLGEHFAPLAGAAIGAGILSGMPIQLIKQGLLKTEGQEHRMVPIVRDDDVILIDDTYNANPHAVKAALTTLDKVAGVRRRVFVFGEMKELGEFERSGHAAVGEYLVQYGITRLYTLGLPTKDTIKTAVKHGLSKKDTFYTNNKHELIMKLQQDITKGDIVLIKGSRSMGMEEIVSELIV